MLKMAGEIQNNRLVYFQLLLRLPKLLSVVSGCCNDFVFLAFSDMTCSICHINITSPFHFSMSPLCFIAKHVKMVIHKFSNVLHFDISCTSVANAQFIPMAMIIPLYQIRFCRPLSSRQCSNVRFLSFIIQSMLFGNIHLMFSVHI